MEAKIKLVGEVGLNDISRAQIEAARNDPRLERSDATPVADFHDAIEEVERVRGLAILGLAELTNTLDRRERELGVSHADVDLSSSNGHALQPYWERTESARIELENEFPLLNAQALICMQAALDALVDSFVPSLRDLQVNAVTDELIRRLSTSEPDLVERMSDEVRVQLADLLAEGVSTRLLPQVPNRIQGSGVKRYEVFLAAVGLDAPEDRPIPRDLDQSLGELSQLRNVILHNAGRIDESALANAPSLRYAEGDFVRITRAEYRRYSAAVNCYAAEIIYRSVRGWPEVSDEADGPRLDNWRNFYRLGS